MNKEKNNEQEIENKDCQKLEQELLQTQEYAAEWKDKCSRIAADFENYKRRAQQDLSSWTFATQKKVFQDLLPIVDDFERAIEQLDTSEQKDISWTEGISMIYDQMKKMLEKNNVTVISTDGAFNPELHEALMQVESEDHEEGQIVATLQKGYAIGEYVLRPAKVSVCK